MAEPSEAKTDLPVVSPIEISDAGALAPLAAASVPPSLETIKEGSPAAEPPKAVSLEEALRSVVEMAAAKSEAARQKNTPPASLPPPVAALAVPRQWRFRPLAASVALAAALGALAGSLSVSGLAHLWSGDGAGSASIEASALQTMKVELAELNTLKSNLDGAARGTNSQFAKLADRLDRVERAQVEPATKIGHIAEAIDRLEKKSATETTGSIGSGPPPAAAAAAAAAEDKGSDNILKDWIVQDVRRGRALVASRYGGVFEVAAGSMLPGLGHVETIKRQDGQWVVVTARGIITER
jgi:hypothetical protein